MARATRRCTSAPIPGRSAPASMTTCTSICRVPAGCITTLTPRWATGRRRMRSICGPPAWYMACTPVTSSAASAAIQATTSLATRTVPRRSRPGGSASCSGGCGAGPSAVIGSRTLDVATGAGVDLDAVAGVDEQRDVDVDARLECRRLGAPGGGVAPEAGLGVGDLQLRGDGQVDAEHLAL